MKKIGILAACLVAWTSSAYARDLDKGTATDDGSGEPVQRTFIPATSDLYFRLTNTTAEPVTLDFVRVRIAEVWEANRVGDGASNPCSGSTTIVGDPLRTTVMDPRDLSSADSQVALGIELDPCEAILIRATGATPGVRHVAEFGAEIQAAGIVIGYLEIWDGECND